MSTSSTTAYNANKVVIAYTISCYEVIIRDYMRAYAPQNTRLFDIQFKKQNKITKQGTRQHF